MTQLPSSSTSNPSPASDHRPQTPVIQINDEPQRIQPRPTHTRSRTTQKSRSPTRTWSICQTWCRAGVLTVLVVFVAYMWLSWTDPDQIELRKMAWDAALERIRGKQVIYAQRYSDQYRFRPAASPIVTETLANGRTRIHGARHGDQIPLPKPTGTEAIKAKRKERRKKKNKKN